MSRGETFSFQKQVVLDTNGFSVTNSGTLALEGYTYSTIPAAITGGTVTIGDKSYTWDSENEKWICAEGSHVTELEENKATCAKAAICDLCGASYGAVDKTNHDTENAEYDNGFCTGCDAYEPAKLVNGVYEISNAGNLYWFADKVTNENAVYGSADAILTCDIRVNEGTMTEASTDARVWTPIGKLGFIDNKRVYYPYTGTFDGQGNTVSGLYYHDTTTMLNAGLFSVVGEGGKVQNVGVADSYISGESCVGAVAGSNYGTVTGCYHTGTVISSGTAGGVVGGNCGTVTNCSNTGTVSGTSEVGGVAGYNSGTATNCTNSGTVSGTTNVGGVAGYLMGEASLTGCYSSGTVSGEDKVGGVVGFNGTTVTGCYFDSTVYTGNAIGTNEGTATNVEGKSTEQFASGEVAYLLSQGENGSIWGQTIGTDPAPVFSDAKVYYGYTSCGDVQMVYTNDPNASTEKPEHTGEVTYTLTADGAQHIAAYDCCGSQVTEDHTYENGKCVCGASQTVVSVDISWGAMEFTYTDGEWQPESHTYAEGEWTPDADGGNVITVENKGNVAINASFAYTKTVEAVSGNFTLDGTNPITEVALDVNGKKEIYLLLTGKPNETNGYVTLGTITVTITTGGE